MLFVWFTCNVSFFYHSHTVGGKKVVHSHSGASNHDHSSNTYQVIDILSQYASTATVIAAAIPFIVFFIQLVTSTVTISDVQLFTERHFSLRAPPVA